MRRFYLYGKPTPAAPLLCLGYVEANAEEGLWGARRKAQLLLGDLPLDLAKEARTIDCPRVINQAIATQGCGWALFKLPGYDLGI